MELEEQAGEVRVPAGQKWDCPPQPHSTSEENSSQGLQEAQEAGHPRGQGYKSVKRGHGGMLLLVKTWKKKFQLINRQISYYDLNIIEKWANSYKK